MRTEEEDEDGRGSEKVKTVPRTLLRDLMNFTRNLQNQDGEDKLNKNEDRME